MIRIGIIQAITGQAIRNFDDSALRYMILAINSFASPFQLEFVPFDTADEFLRPLLAAELTDKPNDKEIMDFYFRQRHYFEQRAQDYGLRDEPPDCFQIISAARFRGRYFWTSNGTMSVIAMGDWERSLSPPSILEFIQVLVLQGALLALCPKLDTHLGTRGCIMDFSGDLSDARQKILSGFICQSCRAIIADRGYPELADELRPILSGNWLGGPDDPTSPAGIVSSSATTCSSLRDSSQIE